jgi:hypothetical protein
MFSEKLYSFLLWLGDFVRDSGTGKPSVKRFGLALCVTVLCGVMLGIGAVITFTTFHAPDAQIVELVRILSSTLEILAGLVLTAVTTGYLVDKANTKGKNNEQRTDKESTDGM